MKRLIPFSFVLVVLALILNTAVGFAAPAAQDNRPGIVSFTTTLTGIGREALRNRTARVPLAWEAVNRPIIANLFFEQVMPDGSTINVELPRVVPWVNSKERGVAAPILPNETATEIVLRVRLVNLLTAQVLATRELRLPITSGNDGSGNAGSRPTLAYFTTTAASVRMDQLEGRTARIPVAWSAVNRPITATMVFEQVLANGSVVNVELPRENPWVNSTESGMTAPVAPGGGDRITLRVRLYDLVTGRVFDQRELTVPIVTTGAPGIRTFTTTATGVEGSALQNRTARIPVLWAVDNRPDNSNLFFEQVFPNGSSANIELPRTVPIISSSGEGMVAPTLPSSGDTITLRVRLVNLGNNTTLAQRDVVLPITGRGGAAKPEILALLSDKQTAAAGDTVTVTWDVRSATRVRVRAAFLPEAALDANADAAVLPMSGSAQFVIPEGVIPGHDGTITLDAYGEPNQPPVSQSVTVQFVCADGTIPDGGMPCGAGEVNPGHLSVEPFLIAEGGSYGLQSGATVTLSLRDAMLPNATQVNFTLTPTGTGTADAKQVIATDTEMGDGVMTTWVVTPGISGHLGVEVVWNDGRVEVLPETALIFAE